MVLTTVLRFRRYTSSFDAKSPIYILLLNIFSPRVTRVTFVPCPNSTQSAQPERSRQRSPSEATRSLLKKAACARLAKQRWRLLQHLHAAHARVKTSTRPPAVRPASKQATTHLLNSTGRCVIPLLIPCTYSRQEERSMPPPSQPSLVKSSHLARCTPRRRRSHRRLWRCARRKPAPHRS